MFYLYACLIGLASGLTSGLFGVGGGIVMVPAMMFLLKTDIKTAIGTSLAVIIPTAVMGALKHHQLSHVSWRMALAIMPMALAGGFCGAWLTRYLSSTDLKRAFGVFLVLVGARLLFLK